MTKTIAINAGSSSLKWQLYQMPEEKVLAKGLIERIGLKDSISTVKFDGRSEQQVLDIDNHTLAVKILLDDLIRFDIIKSYDEITGVGHRVVAGGEYFKESTVVEGDVLEKIEELGLLAPLHNPANAQQCQKKPTVIHCQLSTIQKTRFVSTERTVQAISMLLKKQQNSWDVHLKS